jgi:CobQ-like glutamine amidotransferase family enzyme
MNIYGDFGNIDTLVRRLEWRGFKARVIHVQVGEPFDFTSADIIFGGGGQDRGQLIVGEDLQHRGKALRLAAKNGTPILVVCGLYQLFGHSFITALGQVIPGISVFGATTSGSTTRMIGNIVLESAQFGRLVGFENHSGNTVLDSGQKPLGIVITGNGNSPMRRRIRGFEGAVSENAIGTYLHGPILPKNPQLADHLLLTALRRRYGVTELEPLDDTLEHSAAAIAEKRPQ